MIRSMIHPMIPHSIFSLALLRAYLSYALIFILPIQLPASLLRALFSVLLKYSSIGTYVLYSIYPCPSHSIKPICKNLRARYYIPSHLLPGWEGLSDLSL
ncbi:hypothetical protein F4814DRAFT_311367 [Daldinia grandis]|nr:hypothetical protein F4814DRAFT_311367 [Daldinia grandis]